MAIKLVETPIYPSTATATETVLRNGLMAEKISGNELAEGTIFASKLVVGLQGFVHNLAFTSTDYNTVSWAIGTIQLANNQSYTVPAGSTGNMINRTYIYFDEPTGALLLTTDYATAIGDDKVMICIANPAADTTGLATFTVFQSDGTTIDGAQISTGRVQSQDGRNYMDLDLGQNVVNDGVTNRMVWGYVENGF